MPEQKIPFRPHTVAEAAHLLGVSGLTLIQWNKEGHDEKGRPFRMIRRADTWLVEPAVLERLLAKP